MTKHIAIVGMISLGLVLGSGCGSPSDGAKGDPDTGKNRSGDRYPPEGRDKAPDQVVLGEHIAKAAAAEERRKAKGNLGKSPMPVQKYDRQGDELGLLRPREAPLDSALAELTREFAKANERTRATIRDSISMEEFYTLLAFSQRAAVFALRERSIGRVTNGLTAIAMIEAERVDWRDILVALSLLNHAAERIGSDADRLLREAGRLSEPEVARLIDGFIARSPKEKGLRESWGYDEVEIDGQVGLIGWGFRAYQPTRDLAKAAVDIADFIAKDKYIPFSVEIATELPAVWLTTRDNAALQKALKAVRAGATVSARLRSEEHPHADSQMFSVFLVETADEAAAGTLLKVSQKIKPEGVAMLGVAEKNLFCLLVARPWVAGVESFEKADTLSRFAHGLAGILRSHTR